MPKMKYEELKPASWAKYRYVSIAVFFFSGILLGLLLLFAHKRFNLFLQERENEIQKLRNQVIQVLEQCLEGL